MVKMAQPGARIKLLLFSVFLITIAACNTGNKTESSTTEEKRIPRLLHHLMLTLRLIL